MILKKIGIMFTLILIYWGVQISTNREDCLDQRNTMPLFIEGWLDNLGYLPENLSQLNLNFYNNWKQDESSHQPSLYVGTKSGKARVARKIDRKDGRHISEFLPDCPSFGGVLILRHLISGYECLCRLHNLKQYYFPETTTNENLINLLSNWELSPEFRHADYKKALELIKKSSGLDERDNSGCTPLMLAIRYGCYDLALALIDNNADFNALDNQGETPIQYSLRAFSRSFVYFDTTENLYKTMSKQSITKDISSWRKERYNIDIDRSRRLANDISLKLIGKGATISVIGPANRTLLMEAVLLNLREVVSALINKGIDLSARDKWGHTALFMAKELKCNEITALLIKAGAKE
ncbi:MAG: ankyrin repeat domain-containing protein [Candidatus Wallbacteria bacterium]|nr:ankyrin repeat domain-containing protein [Candidatus Wallbacteria bacterium]